MIEAPLRKLPSPHGEIIGRFNTHFKDLKFAPPELYPVPFSLHSEKLGLSFVYEAAMRFPPPRNSPPGPGG
jgi:hypothetical protein